MSEPTTKAGRRLYDSMRTLQSQTAEPLTTLPSTGWPYRDAILAIEAEARADCETRLCWVWRDVTATARRLVKAEDALADAHAAWPIHIGTYDQHLRVQHAAETEVVTAKAALRAALAADPDEETT